MPETYMNPDRKAYLAQQHANRWQSYVNELKNQETQNNEQGIVDEALGKKLEDASAKNREAQEVADSLFHETPAYKAFTTFQEDFMDYQQCKIDNEVAHRTNSANPAEQQKSIKETEEKRDAAYERMIQSRAALKPYAAKETLKTLDEESQKIEQETDAGIQNILDDSALAPWIDNLIGTAFAQTDDKNAIARFIADEMIKHLYPFGGDAKEVEATRQELINKLSTDDMRRWGSEKTKRRAKANIYQTLLAKLTGDEIKPRHELTRTQRVGSYVLGGSSLVAAVGAFLLGCPVAAENLAAFGIATIANKVAKGKEAIPLVQLNVNWGESGHRSPSYQVDLGGANVYDSAAKPSSTMQLLGTQAPDSLLPKDDPFLSNKMVSDIFLPPEAPVLGSRLQENTEVGIPLRRPEEFIEHPDYRKVWDPKTHTDMALEEQEQDSTSKKKKGAGSLEAVNAQSAPQPEAIEPEQPPERKHFRLAHVAEGPKTGNAFIDGVDAFNRGAESARDGVVDALLHPVETTKELAQLAFDVGNLVTEKTFGVTTRSAKKRNEQRKEAIVDGIRQFREGDTETRIEMATELGVRMLMGGGAGGAGVALVKNAAKKTAATTRRAMTSNLMPKAVLPAPAPKTGLQASRQAKVLNVGAKVAAPKVKTKLRRNPVRSATIASRTLTSTRSAALATTKLKQKAALAVVRKPKSRAVKATAPKEGLLNQAPKGILHRYPLRSRGVGKSLASTTVKANHALKNHGKAPTVDLKGGVKATYPNAQPGTHSSRSAVSGAPLTWQQAAKKAQAVADAAFPPGSIGAGKVWTTKARIKAAQLPTNGKIRFVPPERYNPCNKLKKGNRGGILDRFDNEWTRGPSRTLGEPFEWDVQLSALGRKKLSWASRDGKHLNVSLKGKVTHK